jgi:hypothetical protein
MGMHPDSRTAASAAPPQPTAQDIETARELERTHRRVCVPEPVCGRCLKSWPCAAVRWAEYVLRSGPPRQRRA